MSFKQYKRTSIVEVREVTQEEINAFHNNTDRCIYTMNEFIYNRSFTEQQVLSLTDKQLDLGCPKLGDVIVRNINDSWDVSYVSKEEFNKTFTKYKQPNKNGYTMISLDRTMIMTKRVGSMFMENTSKNRNAIRIYKTLSGLRAAIRYQPNEILDNYIIVEIKNGYPQYKQIIIDALT